MHCGRTKKLTDLLLTLRYPQSTSVLNKKKRLKKKDLSLRLEAMSWEKHLVWWALLYHLATQTAAIIKYPSTNLKGQKQLAFGVALTVQWKYPRDPKVELG